MAKFEPALLPLPLEIIELIIDEIASAPCRDKSTEDTLRACTLVCSAFHFRSRHHLFSHLNLLLDSGYEKKLKNLSTVLFDRQTPRTTPCRILEFVRSFTLTFDIRSQAWRKVVQEPPATPSLFSMLGIAQLGQSPHSESKLGKNLLVNILERLARRAPLKAVTLQAMHGTFDMCGVLPDLDVALWNLMTLKTLKHLKISRLVNVDLHVLIANFSSSDIDLKEYSEHQDPEFKISRAQLSSLALEDMKFAFGDNYLPFVRAQSEDSNFSYPIRTLERLDLRHLDSITIHHILHLAIFTPMVQLRSVVASISFNRHDIRAFLRILQRSSRTLEELEIFHIERLARGDSSFELGELVALRTLKVHLNCDRDIANPNLLHQLEELNTMLALPWTRTSGSSPSQIRSLILRFRVYIPGTGEMCSEDLWRTIDSSPACDAWSKLDKTLAERTALPDLKEVVIDANYQFGGSVERSSAKQRQIKEELRKRLTRHAPLLSRTQAIKSMVSLSLVGDEQV